MASEVSSIKDQQSKGMLDKVFPTCLINRGPDLRAAGLVLLTLLVF